MITSPTNIGTRTRRASGSLLCACLCALILCATSSAAPTLLQTVQVDNPQFVTTATDNAVWFSSANADRLAVYRVGTIGNVESRSLSPRPEQFSVAGIARGSNGRIWISLRSKRKSMDDRLYLLDRKLTAKRVIPRSKTSLRVRNLAPSSSGAVWARSGAKLLRISSSGKLRDLKLPTRPAVVQIATTKDGSIWGVGQSGVVRVSPSGKISKRSITSGSPVISAAGSGVWLGAQSELIHLDSKLSVTRVALAQPFDEDGVSARIVVGVAGAPDGSASFLAVSGYVAKDVIHAGKPSVGTVSGAVVVENRLEAAYDLDLSDKWEQAISIGASIFGVGPSSSYAMAEFGPGLRIFSAG